MRSGQISDFEGPHPWICPPTLSLKCRLGNQLFFANKTSLPSVSDCKQPPLLLVTIWLSEKKIRRIWAKSRIIICEKEAALPCSPAQICHWITSYQNVSPMSHRSYHILQILLSIAKNVMNSFINWMICLQNCKGHNISQFIYLSKIYHWVTSWPMWFQASFLSSSRDWRPLGTWYWFQWRCYSLIDLTILCLYIPLFLQVQASGYRVLTSHFILTTVLWSSRITSMWLFDLRSSKEFHTCWELISSWSPYSKLNSLITTLPWYSSKSSICSPVPGAK